MSIYKLFRLIKIQNRYLSKFTKCNCTQIKTDHRVLKTNMYYYHNLKIANTKFSLSKKRKVGPNKP